MQQQQQYAAYPYWQQPVYPQPQSQSVYPQPLPAPSNGGYTPYPGHYIPLGPQPSGFDPAAYQQPPHEPVTPRPQKDRSKHRRANTVTAVPTTPAQPLKSALKKTNTLNTFPTIEHPLTRSRTNSVSRPESSLHRIRTQSNARANGTGKIIGDDNALNYARKSETNAC
jgi:hypothetical protein